MNSYRVIDYRSNQYEVEIVNLNNGNIEVKKVRADNKKNAMQIAVEGYAEWMVGMTTSTLRDYYIEKNNIFIKEPIEIEIQVRSDGNGNNI